MKRTYQVVFNVEIESEPDEDESKVVDRVVKTWHRQLLEKGVRETPVRELMDHIWEVT